MAKKAMKVFDVLIEVSDKFVEGQKGGWDHDAWLDFLSDVREKGIELSDEMKDSVGSVLESMKKVYDTTTATKGLGSFMSDISELTVKFITKHKGTWDQSGWEAYLKVLQKKGIDLTDETKAYLEEVLESTKELYSVLMPLESKTKTKSKAKT